MGRTRLAVTRSTLRRAAPTVLAILLTVALALPAGAKDAKRPSRASTTATTTTTWPPLPAFDSALAWSDCGGGYQCATLTVPVDWSAPTGESLGLALIRRPAAVSDQRIGSLVFNYGGPGESGVDELRALSPRLPETVRDRYDLVSFDPRGTGASRPVDCVDDAFLDQSTDLPAVPTTPDQIAALDQYNAQFAAGCVQRSGAYAGQVGTRNAARDLEAIRIALGEPHLDYVGYSYGTILGATYAQMFPGSVGRLVLDGPPDYWISADGYAFRQARGFMDALTAFLAWCQQTGCSLAASGAPRDALNQLIARVDQAPMPATYTLSGGATRQATLTSSSLENGVISLLYDRSRGWPALSEALGEAITTGNGGMLLAYSDQYLGRSPDGHWDPLVEANAVISCVDRPTERAPTPAEELTDVASFQYQLPPWGGSFATAACVGMPKPAPGDALGDVHVRGTAPILVIGTTGDPATPYAGAQGMALRVQGSGLLTFDSTEHTAFGRGISTCIDDAVVAYLVAGTMPATGTHCAPD
jgi:pimeloyl-ACP methyl ester carboxylesterase